MTNKQLLILLAAIYGIFAVALFFLPAIMWPLYGLKVNDQYAHFLSQHNSIFLGGLAVIAWIWRDVEQGSDAARKIFLGFIWTNSLGIVITLYACITGAFSGFGWSDPAFFTLMAVLCVVQLRKNTA